jgi:hypothetical protein
MTSAGPNDKAATLRPSAAPEPSADDILRRINELVDRAPAWQPPSDHQRRNIRGIALTGMVIAATLALWVLNIEVGQHIAPDWPVLVHPIAGFYATAGCVAAGHVATSYIENPEDIGRPGQTLLRGEPSVEIRPYREAVALRGIDGAARRPDPQCNEFYEWKALWRQLIGW